MRTRTSPRGKPLAAPLPVVSSRPGETRYTRRTPEKTVLHRVVREQLESFLARATARGQPPPSFIEQELRAYLRCGVLAHGFLRLHCDDCGHDRLVASSCKRRGFCPSCGGRRMADTAAHLVDRVLPEVPIRQWVLTLPYPLRYRCAYDARLASEVLRAFLRALFAELRRRTRRKWQLRPDQCGAVTFIQRFGSAMNLNLHFHTLALDGVYTGSVLETEPPRFLPLPPPSSGEVVRVLAGTARRIHRLIEKRAADDEEALARDEPLLAVLAAASLQTRIATGPAAGAPWRRLGDRVEPGEGSGRKVDPDASPRVPRHGGILAPAASLRDRVAPYNAGCNLEANQRSGKQTPDAMPQTGDTREARDEKPPRARIRWARLLMRVFEVAGQLGWPSACESKTHRDALCCPECGARLRLLAAIEDPEVASKILACLDLPVRAPPILPAQAAAVRVEGDPTYDDLDQTPAFADPW